MTSRRPLRLIATILALLTVTVGCGGADAAGSIVISGAVMAVPSTDDGAIYFTIENRSDVDDDVVGATTEISAVTHLHRSTIDGQGLGAMDLLAGVPVPAGATVRLAPGGVHLMAMAPAAVSVGDRFDLTVLFREAGAVRATVDVVAVVEPDSPS